MYIKPGEDHPVSMGLYRPKCLKKRMKPAYPIKKSMFYELEDCAEYVNALLTSRAVMSTIGITRS
jgi:hypothetical protein